MGKYCLLLLETFTILFKIMLIYYALFIYIFTHCVEFFCKFPTVKILHMQIK